MTTNQDDGPSSRWSLAATLAIVREVLRALGDGLAASAQYKRLRALGYDHATAAARALGTRR